jgi:hypothetical protein
MNMTQEPNDALTVKLLGIKSLTVQFDDMSFAGGIVKPTSAEVGLSEDTYSTVEPTNDQQHAVRTWAAGKLGISINSIEVL